MFEVLKDTPRRLVIASGAGRRPSRYILDKDAGRGWFDRPWRSMLRIALADIVAIDAIDILPPQAASEIVLKLASGQRYRLAVETGKSAEAAKLIGTFLDLPEATSIHTTKASSRARRWATLLSLALAAVAIVLTAAGQIANLLILPDCDSSRARQTATELLQAKSADPVNLAEMVRTGRTSAENRCQARLTVAGDTAVVGYRIYWDGWSAMVRMTGAVGTLKLDPARMNAISKAVDDFLELARESHLTGNPPRQTDPAVDTLLTAVFDTRGLAGILAPSEMDSTIEWFNAGDSIGSVYVLAGSGFNDLAKLPATDAMQQRMRANVVRFADEFGRYTNFQMTILAAIAEAQMSFIANGPDAEIAADDFRAKVADVHGTFSQAMKSNFISLVYDGLSNDWRMSRLATLARIAPVAARYFSKDEARGIAEQAIQTLDYFSDPTVKATVREIAGSISAPN